MVTLTAGGIAFTAVLGIILVSAHTIKGQKLEWQNAWFLGFKTLFPKGIVLILAIAGVGFEQLLFWPLRVFTMFALMAPLIISGSWVEKMRFEAFLGFILIWPFVVYYPIAHWIWNQHGII